MQTEVDMSHEYPPEKQLEFICRIAARDYALIGQTVLIRHLPAGLAKVSPEAHREVEKLFHYFGHPGQECQRLGLSIVGFDASDATSKYSKVYLNDGHGTTPVEWNILLLAVFGNQEV